MPRPDAEQAVLDRFQRRYVLARSGTMRALERYLCCCDYGATSWTTRAEADRLASALDLGPGKRLLDIGSGTGWPALYVAGRSGCDVTLTDVPLQGLEIARERARQDGPAGACWISAADGAALPFRSASFDAVYHSDVLCCLADKAAVLAEARRVVRPGGRMVFSVIALTPGLRGDALARALAGGPPFVETPKPYPELVRDAGWDLTGTMDLTAQYLATVSRVLDREQEFRDEIGRVLDDADAEESMAKRHATRAALQAGLLRRDLFQMVPAGRS